MFATNKLAGLPSPLSSKFSILLTSHLFRELTEGLTVLHSHITRSLLKYYCGFLKSMYFTFAVVSVMGIQVENWYQGRPGEGVRSSVAGITGIGELSNMGAGNLLLIL